MALHGMLHRIEGDVENARCWYLDVLHSDIFAATWPMYDYTDPSPSTTYDSKPAEARAKLPAVVTEFLDRIQRLRAHVLKSSVNPLPAGMNRADEELELEAMSAQEIFLVREFCEMKFGTERCPNALEAYVGVGEQRGEIGVTKNKMLVGGEGFRHF